jgi:hypothetical protein
VWNEEVLHTVKEERNILHKKANLIGHILHRNCPLKHVIEGKIEGMIYVTGRYGRRSQQPMDDLNEKRGCWKLKHEVLVRILWRTCFGKGHGSVVKQTTEWMKELVEWMNEWLKITFFCHITCVYPHREKEIHNNVCYRTVWCYICEFILLRLWIKGNKTF